MMEKKDILIIHGTDYKNMTIRILKRAGLAELIGDRNKRIGLKPNLVVARDPSEGATTHSEILEGVVAYLQECGFNNLIIMEGSWVGDNTRDAFRAAGYERISRQYGVPFKDMQADTWKSCDAAGMDIRICDTAVQMDFMINLPVLKGHCQTLITCALKNNKGLIPNAEKRRFHTLGLHRPIAHLNTVVRNDFILVDNICGDLDFEEGGNPVVMNRILAFRDPVLCDAFVCESMGHKPEEVDYIMLAQQLGVGSADTAKAHMVYLNEDLSAKKMPPMTGRVKKTGLLYGQSGRLQRLLRFPYLCAGPASGSGRAEKRTASRCHRPGLPRQNRGYRRGALYRLLFQIPGGLPSQSGRYGGVFGERMGM